MSAAGVEPLLHPLGQIFEIDLMHNANPRRHNAKGLKSLLSPFKKLITLPVPLELHVKIQAQRLRPAGKIDLYRVVNHQIDGHKRLDDLRIAIHLRYRRTHSRKIYKQRHSGEILQDNPRHDERNLLLNRIFGIPIRQSLNVDLRNLFPVTVSKHGLEYDSDTDGSLEIVPTPASSSTGSE
jgi:hypothetical protein